MILRLMRAECSRRCQLATRTRFAPNWVLAFSMLVTFFALISRAEGTCNDGSLASFAVMVSVKPSQYTCSADAPPTAVKGSTTRFFWLETVARKPVGQVPCLRSEEHT